MGMYFRCYGYFLFENKTEAKNNFDVLISGEDSLYLFCPNELALIESKIEFKTYGNFFSYSTCEKTCDLIGKVSEKALEGIVKIDEGDGEDNMWSWKTYSVSDKKVFRSHTDPQRSYKFKGELEFENEEAAKNACRMLLTDRTNSIFTKFPANQIVFADDKRLISYKNKFLKIDVHCPGNSKICLKTMKLLNRVGYIHGNIECTETYALRFIPENSENSSDWVNDMKLHIFYHYSGNLTFNTNDDAKNALYKLLNDEKSVFMINAKNSFPVYIDEAVLFFDDLGNCNRELYNSTDDLIREIAVTAIRGKVEGAFSNTETMDSFVVDRILPSKVRKSLKTSESIEKKRKD